MSKYDPLSMRLRSLNQATVQMSFGEIESILGFPLPQSARKFRPWWSNEASGNHVQARAWLDAGYQTTAVEIAAEKLVFVRLNRTDAPEDRVPVDHPLWGAMAGTITYLDDVDLTEPSDPDWADLADEADIPR